MPIAKKVLVEDLRRVIAMQEVLAQLQSNLLEHVMGDAQMDYEAFHQDVEALYEQFFPDGEGE